MEHNDLKSLLELKELTKISDTLYDFKSKDFYAFLEISLENFWLEKINEKLSALHQEYWKINWFTKNLQACILVKVDDIKKTKKQKSSEIINIEDDEYFANKYVILYTNEQDIIDYIESSLPLFYKDSVATEETMSLSQLENEIEQINPYLSKTLKKRIIDEPDWKDTDFIIQELINNIESLESYQTTVQSEDNNTNQLISIENWFIKSIALNNFRNSKYDDRTDKESRELFALAKTKYILWWENGINTLSWPNWLGKTTLYHAIEWLLFGEIELQEHKKWEGRWYDILCNTETWENNYYVVWVFISDTWVEKTIIRKSWNELIIDGESADNNYCESFFWISHSEYKNFMYLPQNNYLQFVVDANKNEREKILSPLMWVDMYDKIIKNIWDWRWWLANAITVKIEDLQSRLNSDISSKTWITNNPRNEIIEESEYIKWLPWFDDKISEEAAKRIAIFLWWIQKHIINNIEIRNQKIAENYSSWYERNRKELGESIKNDYKEIIDQIDSKDDIIKKINEIEKNINTWEKRKEITKHIQNKKHDTTLYINYDFELFPEIKELVLQYCAECDKIASQSKDISNLEENIGKVLHYVKENEKSQCPTCLTPFESSNLLIQNIQKSIELVKLHLSTQKRDEIYENIIKHDFMTSWNKLESDIADWKNDVQNHKRIFDKFEFILDLKLNNYQNIETDINLIGSNNNLSYVSLKTIDDEYQKFVVIDAIQLEKIVKLFDNYDKYLNSQKNNNINSEIQTYSKIQDKLTEYKKLLNDKIKDYKQITIESMKDIIKSYIKSIIKYQCQWSIILENWQLKIEEKEQIPDFTFSQWQLSAVALGCLLAFYKNIQKKSKLKCLLIDDPIQTIDDLNALNLINILRYQFQDYQIILSTHEWQFDTLLRYKFKVLWLNENMIDMKNLTN